MIFRQQLFWQVFFFYGETFNRVFVGKTFCTCKLIEPSVSIKGKISFRFPIVKKAKLELGPKDICSFGPFFYSKTYNEISEGTCRHYLYGTDLHIIGNDETKASGLVVEVDGVQELTGDGDTVCFFLEPLKWYTYKIYSKDELIKTDSFSIDREYSVINIKLDGGTYKSDSVPVTTTTVSTPQYVTHTVTSAIDSIIESNPDHVMIEYGQLGDHVYYSLYPDGLLYISGYGPMNKDDDPITNKELVKNVLFEGYSNCMREIIDTDGDETIIEEYIKKYHEDICALYLEKDKEHFIDILNKDYGVEKDDPLLDEMIDDYIYANS